MAKVFRTKDLLVNILDQLADENPNGIYAQFPVTANSYAAGFRDITYRQFAITVNTFARWLITTLGPACDYETLTYIGPNDLRYPALVLACNKVGYKVLLASPRNSPTAQWHLLNALNCRKLLTSNPEPLAVSAIRKTQERDLQVCAVPTVDELLEGSSEPFPCFTTFQEARGHPFVILHTSGTTGIPKPIIWPHDYVASLAIQVQLDPPKGYESNDRLYSGNRVFIFFPPFHAAYHAHALINALTNGTRIIFPLPTAIPSAQGLSDALQHTSADAAFVVPLMVEELSKDTSLLRHVSENLSVIVYAGGDLPQASGNVVTQKIKLINYYGATEVGSIALLRKSGEWDRDIWKYITFHPKTGINFRKYDGDLHELYIVRQEANIEYQPTFALFTNLSEYGTRDLWIQHPTRTDAWRHCGRADDIIVFLTGEKTNPISMEQYIMATNMEISAVLVAGSLRFQAALLIELKGTETREPEQLALLLEKFWSSIEHANQMSPAHARIAMSHVLFTKPDRPMQRTPKGTVQRQRTLADYAAELDQLYADVDFVSNSYHNTLGIPGTITDPGELIRQLIKDISNVQLNDDDNFFEQGLDSLQVLTLTRELRIKLRLRKFAAPQIYANPSIYLLNQALGRLADENMKSSHKKQLERQVQIQNTLTRYVRIIRDLPISTDAYTVMSQSTSSHVVILTGSTGFLGTYILHTLMESTSVSQIYCINRSKDAAALQNQRHQFLGLNTRFDDRVTFFRADIGQPYFGVSETVYQTLVQNVTVIIHNAWPVNFNLPLENFTPQFDGILELVYLISRAARPIKLFFVSSVSSVQALKRIVPETICTDVTAPLSMGYAESKFIAERILAEVHERLHIPIFIARIGQIAGPVEKKGLWNVREWLPSLVISSAHLRALPETLPSNLNLINWLPVDLLARIITNLSVVENELTGATTSHEMNGGPSFQGMTICHLLNPSTIMWENLVDEVASSISSIKNIPAVEIVSYPTWVRLVRNDLEQLNRASNPTKTHGNEKTELEEALGYNPAAKLLNFFEEETTAGSQAQLLIGSSGAQKSLLDAVGPIRREWMSSWVHGWLNISQPG